MDLKFLFTQCLAILGAVLYFLSYQCRSNRKLYTMQFFFVCCLYCTFHNFRSYDRRPQLHIESDKIIIPRRQVEIRTEQHDVHDFMLHAAGRFGHNLGGLDIASARMCKYRYYDRRLYS